MSDMVLAAGGVVWRMADGAIEVLIIHRPGRNWSLPKGKLDPGESIEECAVREVEEETGFRCERGPELPSAHYVLGSGRRKFVRFWAMTVIDGEFVPNSEADEIRWLTVPDALRMVDRDRDIAAIGALESALATV